MRTENQIDKENTIKEMVIELYKIYFICTIPMVALTLAFYEMFGSNSEPLFDFLRSKIVVNLLFVTGVVSMFWCSHKIYKVIVKAQKHNNESKNS